MKVKCLMEIKNPNHFRVGQKYILSNRFMEVDKTIEIASYWEVQEIDDTRVYYDEIDEDGVNDSDIYYKENLMSESFKKMYKIEIIKEKQTLKSIDDYVHPDESLKVVDFQKRKEEKESAKEDIKSTKYDFTLGKTDYKLETNFYHNGILCVYVHDVVQNMGPVVIHRQCGHNEQFFELTKWDKFLNFLGADIRVVDKVEKALPKYKEETLKELEKEKALQDEEKRLRNKLK